eukprot:m.52838 g.52838  ORF g.52838 m.52838 type:complete len:416 (+) comp11339_c0_seq3:511-1758(+)
MYHYLVFNMDTWKQRVDAVELIKSPGHRPDGFDVATRKAVLETERRALLAQISQVEETSQIRSQLVFLKGRLLSLSDQYDPECERCLARAVKLDRDNLAAWNLLGECFWKKGDLTEAEKCFEHVQLASQYKDVDSLHHLSMLLRQKRVKGKSEQLEAVRTSIDKAKEAIKLDISNGHSWFVLGNAYLTLFFGFTQDQAHLQQALKAYKRACADAKEEASNPDLHYNCSTIYNFLQDYSDAIQCLERTLELEPDNTSAGDLLESILKQLAAVQRAISSKIKPKKLQTYVKAIESKGSASTLLAHLIEGDNSDKSISLYIFAVLTDDPMTQVFAAVDAAGETCRVTVSNMVDNGVRLNDTVSIGGPVKRSVLMRHGGTTYAFTSLRVTDPRTITRNGARLGDDAVLLSQLSVESRAI